MLSSAEEGRVVPGTGFIIRTPASAAPGWLTPATAPPQTLSINRPDKDHRSALTSSWDTGGQSGAREEEPDG